MTKMTQIYMISPLMNVWSLTQGPCFFLRWPIFEFKGQRHGAEDGYFDCPTLGKNTKPQIKCLKPNRFAYLFQ